MWNLKPLHHALATLATLGSSFSYPRSYHHWTEIKIIMDYFICTINRNRLFHSFVTYFIFLALFLVIRRSFFGPLSFSFFFFFGFDQVILLCASVARSSHVHVPLSLPGSLFLCYFYNRFLFRYRHIQMVFAEGL